MKQTQGDIWEIKTSVKCWQNHLKETEDRLSVLATRNHERKDSFKISRNKEIQIQWLKYDSKKNSLRVIFTSEEAGLNPNEIKKLFTEVIAQNFPNMG